jgi:hypothetical protein
VASVNSSASGTDCTPISWLTLRKACSIDMPDSTQIRRSMASGKDLRIDVWRLLIVFFRKSSGALIAPDCQLDVRDLTSLLIKREDRRLTCAGRQNEDLARRTDHRAGHRGIGHDDFRCVT